MIPQEIWNEVAAAASAAAIKHNDDMPPEARRGFDCGFAWIVVRPARGAFVAWCKQQGYGRSGYRGGMHIWYSKLHQLPTQSISVHQAAVDAAVKILRKHGIDAVGDSRLD